MGDDLDDIVREGNICQYASKKRDCDGDWITFCYCDGYCIHKKNVRDCDGDIISVCNAY